MAAATLGCLVVKATIAAVLLAVAAVGSADCALVHKTIQSDDGDIIDCVDFYEQPALKDAPPAVRRQIQAKKPEKSIGEMMAGAASASSRAQMMHHQSWRKNGSCPAGTVPIRRESSRANPEIAELIRRSSPFGRPGSSSSNQFGRPALAPAGSYDNQSAMAAPPGGKVEGGLGAAVEPTVCNWKVPGSSPSLYTFVRVKIDVHPNEFSMGYLLVGGTLDGNYRPMPGAEPPADLTNQIAVGLVASPSIFGDSLTRLFVYYTTDGGQQVNCFNLDCNGFQLKENSPFALGSTWSDSDSQIGGDRHSVTDPTGLNWWVSVMGQDIGYFPETQFNTRFPEAVYVEMGGRVLDSRPGGKHTTTAMGSGIPACAGSRLAATITEYLAVGYNGVLIRDSADRTITTTPSCYSAQSLGFSHTRTGFYVSYGGPGGIYCDQPDS